jgi:hypothetical protein
VVLDEMFVCVLFMMMVGFPISLGAGSFSGVHFPVQDCFACKSSSLSTNSNLADSYPVDIFYLALAGKAPYLQYGYFWTVPATALAFAEVRNYTVQGKQFTTLDTRIHILSDDDKILSQARALRFESHDVRGLRAQWQEIYANIEACVTAMEYAVTFFRWLVIREVIDAWNTNKKDVLSINRIVVADLDIYFSTNAARFFTQTLSSLLEYNETTPTSTSTSTSSTPWIDLVSEFEKERFEYVDISLGALSLFSPRGLTIFANQLQAIFSASRESSKKYCSHWFPYFSDMEMLIAFAKENNATRSRCLGQYETLPACFQRSMGCTNMRHYRNELKKHAASIYFDGQVVAGWNRTMQVRHQNWRNDFQHLPGRLTIQSSNEVLPYCTLVSYPRVRLKFHRLISKNCSYWY